jgi:hypothetical protein
MPGDRLWRLSDLIVSTQSAAAWSQTLSVRRAAKPHELPMPSLIRLIVILGILSGFAYGAIFALATLVEPKPREITVTIPQDRLAKPR